MRSVLWLCLLSLLLAGCGEDELRARYSAEKARYWAERQALRFSLQSDPQMRRRYYESGLAFLGVAHTANPALQAADLSEEMRSELLELEAFGRLQAGSAFLRAGYFELADPELIAVQERGPAKYQRQAALLRAEAARVRRDWGVALERYREFHGLLREAPEELSWDEELLQLPLTFLDELKAGGAAEELEAALADGHAFYAWIQEHWPDTPMAKRAAFLDHRLDLIAERWEEARLGIERYARGDIDDIDQWYVRFDLAEILGPGMGRTEEADALYREVGEGAPEENLRALAWLRRGELLLNTGNIEEGMAALEEVETSYRQYEDLASAAMLSRATQIEAQGDWSKAQQLLRRIVVRHSDTPAGVAAPMRMVKLQEARGDERGVEAALLSAETQYRRLVAGHSLDGDIGLQSRRALIQCLLWSEKPEDALAELEQMHHILGRGPGGAEALLQAARVAADELGDEELSRRYLEWIVRELPVTPAASEAREMLQQLSNSSTESVGD